MARRKIRFVLKPLPKWWGLADKQARTIKLESRADDLTMMDAAAHEVIHVMCPWMLEYAVSATASEIADVLYRLGFRRTDQPE